MASFRSGFKIFGELSLKQGFGRIRSFSEDRRPGKWSPEDQWAVRQPGSICPDPCEKLKKSNQKSSKSSKSWLNLCKDPGGSVNTCDYRLNNCPPPKEEEGAPWFSLDNLIPKKKQEKSQPLGVCREELKRAEEEEEVCCEIVTDNTKPPKKAPECISKEPCPAPVLTLSCPLPKELDLMLWCSRAETSSPPSSVVPMICHKDNLPYQEFRPQKIWKPPPFSLPCKYKENCAMRPKTVQSGPVEYDEFKQVEVPKPVYTRYKSVDLTDSSLSFNMISVKCPENEPTHVPASKKAPTPDPDPIETLPEEPEMDPCEKPILVAASCKPTKLKNAPKYTFREKLTKLVERRQYKNPLSQCKNSLHSRIGNQNEKDERSCSLKSPDSHPPKVITGTLTSEPQSYEKSFALTSKPPEWMYVLSKPGTEETPLVPCQDKYPKEPDWSGETDGLKFYDSNNGNITPKPPPDPSVVSEKSSALIGKKGLVKECPSPLKDEEVEMMTRPREVIRPPCVPRKCKFILMPEEYNIKQKKAGPDTDDLEEDSVYSSFEQFIEAKSTPQKKTLQSFPPMKENILYDLQRLCQNLPHDPKKLCVPCRKPPEPECPRPPKFYRSFSTFSPPTLKNLCFLEINKIQARTECGDSSGKCKIRPQKVHKEKECEEKIKKMKHCSDLVLPCCPKPKVPPSCDERTPLINCQKKKAPKPSFSECQRDALPCPRITECNCWEKKSSEKHEKKGEKKYSDWAALKCDIKTK